MCKEICYYFMQIILIPTEIIRSNFISSIFTDEETEA